MRVAIIGAGRVGLVSAACLAESGFAVTCVDRDPERIAALREGCVRDREPGLEALVARNAAARRLAFAEDAAGAVPGAEVVMIAVGTPARPGDGGADLSAVFDAARDIADALAGRAVVATKSTVPPGTGREIARVIRTQRPGAAFEIASNPEFLRAGSAVDDFMRPDRIVVGTGSGRATEVMRTLCEPFLRNGTPALFTSVETAELVKYAANGFLATRIAYVNELADLCERLGADVQEVARGIGLDRRIGRHCLRAGPGFGGPCLPKDVAALARLSREAGAPSAIVEAVLRKNAERTTAMVGTVERACGGSVAGRRLAALGVTFKPGTDDVRNSPSVEILRGLAARGAKLRAFDPAGMDGARRLLGGVTPCRDAWDAMKGADALVVLTDWSEFRTLDLGRVRCLLRTPLVVDLRGILDPAGTARAGLRLVSVGRASAGAPS